MEGQAKEHSTQAWGDRGVEAIKAQAREWAGAGWETEVYWKQKPLCNEIVKDPGKEHIENLCGGNWCIAYPDNSEATEMKQVESNR